MEPVAATPDFPPTEESLVAPRRSLTRVWALAEVLLCSSFPTQLAIAYVMEQYGYVPFTQAGRLSLEYVVTLSLADAVMLTTLILVLLLARRESPRRVLLGDRPPWREALLGLPLIPVAFGLVIVATVTLRFAAPWLHNVAHNPIEDLIRSPTDAAWFTLVAILSGGVREEVQRGFIIHRFEHLGGARVGICVFSVVFGLGHFLQGWDAAIATGLLGAFWGIMYLKRGSILAPLVSHAGFNTAEIFRYAFFGF